MKMKSITSKGVLGYLQKREKERLFKQWVDRSGLPAEEIPLAIESEPSLEESVSRNDAGLEKESEYTTFIGLERGIIRLPLRYVLIGLSVIGILLIALSVVSTMLIVH